MRPGTTLTGGSWRSVLGPPGRHLRQVVSSYAEYEETAAAPVARREVPGPASVLVIELAGPLHAAGAAETDQAPVWTFLGSPGRGPALTWHAGYQHCVEVRLTLLGTYRLFGPLGDLAGRIAPLDALWGRVGSRLPERLVAAGTWERRFDVLDQVLGAALGAEPDPEVTHAWQRLESTAGAVAVGDLVRETGWGRGRLATRFRAQTGLTPKAAATLLRFSRATELLGARTPLAEVALTCGYYDQSHFNRDFRALAGCSPTAWLTELVTFVQDGDDPGFYGQPHVR